MNEMNFIDKIEKKRRNFRQKMRKKQRRDGAQGLDKGRGKEIKIPNV